MGPTVTFETQCYENDYEHILTGTRLQEAIDNCNYDFAKRVVIINKVANRKKVAALAQECKDKGIIDDYYFADDYVDEALKHFGIDPASFGSGYYVSRCQLIGLYRSETDYHLHFTTDSHIKDKNKSCWIAEAIERMEKDVKYICATPLWDYSLEGAKAEALEDLGDWYAGYGFSDNCYLVPTKLFKTNIYNEYNPQSDRYPAYAQECFEKRVDSYMRNHGYLRLINKKVSYVNTRFPKKRSVKVGNYAAGILPRARTLTRLIVGRLLPRKNVNPMEARTAIIGKAEGMKEYRDEIKIYDIFTFFNELDLLEMRLEILAPYVDYFIIVECTQTFSGLPKPLIFKENEDRFKKYKDKIIHYVTDDVPDDEADMRLRLKNKQLSGLEREVINRALTSDNVPPGQVHWLKEFYQKESIKKALTGLKDDDICYIGDVDEIWNPEAIFDYRSDDIFKLRQDVSSYYLNNRSNEPWAGTLVAKYKHIKNACLSHLRTVTKTQYTYIKDGGWHFTNQGGADRIRKKLESYGHQEFNNEAIKSDLESKMKANKDFVGRDFKFWVDESGLPEYIKNNKQKYQEYFRT